MKTLWAILAICGFILSCTRDKKIKPDYSDYIQPINLADYCFFRQGSYWVYQDSISGSIDCTYVSAANVVTYTINESDGKDYTGTFHYYNMITKDGIGDERQYEVYDEEAAQTARCCNGRYKCETHWNRPARLIDTMGNYAPGIYFGSYTHMFNVFNNGTTGGTGVGEQCTSRGKMDQLTVDANIFNNIVVFDHSINYSDPNWITHTYRYKDFISKYIGIVKRIETDSNQVWLLKRYRVIQ